MFNEWSIAMGEMTNHLNTVSLEDISWRAAKSDRPLAIVFNGKFYCPICFNEYTFFEDAVICCHGLASWIKKTYEDHL